MRGRAPALSSNDLLDYSYDQSHFINEMKLFTRFTPQRARDRANEFGKAFSAKPQFSFLQYLAWVFTYSVL
jgi:hypothetical protein